MRDVGAGLATGQSVTITLTGTVSSSATGTLTNTVTVAPPGTMNDLTPANNTATDSDTLTPQADLQITKTDTPPVTTSIPGMAITYTIVVTNAGPSDVTGAIVNDTFPATLTSISWTASADRRGLGLCQRQRQRTESDRQSAPEQHDYLYGQRHRQSLRHRRAGQHRHGGPAGRSHGPQRQQQRRDGQQHADAAGRPANGQDRRQHDVYAGSGDHLHDRGDQRRSELRHGRHGVGRDPRGPHGRDLDGRVRGRGLQRQRQRVGLPQRDDPSGGRRDGDLHADGHRFADGHGRSGEHGHGHRSGGHHGLGAGKQHGDGYGHRGPASRPADYEDRRQCDVHAGTGNQLYDRRDQRRSQFRDRRPGGGHDSGGHRRGRLDGRVHGHGLQRQSQRIGQHQPDDQSGGRTGRQPTR